MRILIIGMVVLALSVAGISTYLIQSFSTPEALGELEKQARIPTYHTLVADIKLQPGDVLSADNVQWRAWPDEGLNEHYITVEEDAEREARLTDVIGSVVRRQIQAGEPVLASKIFKSDQPGFMAGVLDRGMRAVSMAITANNGVAGFILPGDRIDILVVHNQGREAIQRTQTVGANALNAGPAAPPASEQLKVLRTTTETIMRNILVLAVNQTLGDVEGQTITAKTLTMQMTPKEVEVFMTLKTLGKVTVALRDLRSTQGEGLDEAGIGTYTNDVEVSPFIAEIVSKAVTRGRAQAKMISEKAAALKKQKEQQTAADEVAAKAAADEAAAIAAADKATVKAAQIRAAAQKKVKPVTTAPKKKKVKKIIEIYRAGAEETEVIELK